MHIAGEIISPAVQTIECLFRSVAEVNDVDDTAVLSSFDQYTTFSYAGTTLTFRTCNGLERYTRVLTWDNGYLEVLAKYRQRDSEIEEFIDLEPILSRLYMDKTAFLSPIKHVKIEYV